MRTKITAAMQPKLRPKQETADAIPFKLLYIYMVCGVSPESVPYRCVYPSAFLYIYLRVCVCKYVHLHVVNNVFSHFNLLLLKVTLMMKTPWPHESNIF